jgi:signal transduction histidine kinase
MKVWLCSALLVLLCGVTYPAVGSVAIDPQSSRRAVDSLINLSKHLMLKKPDLARHKAELALVIAKSIGYKRGIGRSFNSIGASYWVQSVLPISQFYLISAIPYLQNDNEALVNCYKYIGRNYVDLKDYKQASYYFSQALNRVKTNVSGKAEIYTELTSLYNATGNYKQGLKYIDTALKYSRKIDNGLFISVLYNRRGQIYIGQKKLEEAKANLDTCYQLSITTRNKRLQAITLIDLARLSLMKNDAISAATYANEAILLADTLGAVELKLRSLNTLTNIYIKQNNAQQINHTQASIIKLYEQIEHINNNKTLQLIQDYFVLNNKLDNVELINRNNTANEAMIAKQHRTMAMLVVSLVTALTFLVIIFISYKQKNDINNKLQARHQVLIDQKALIELQRTDLESVNNLKNKLLAIIGHDLRTPIASLISIADLFDVEYITADEVKKLMLDLTPVIKGAELTLTNLMEFAGSQIKGQNINAVSVDVCDIVDEMEQTFQHQLQQKNIAFSNKCVHGQYIWADANHIKVILRNLISNAIKFTNSGGSVKVVSSVIDGEMRLCVEDTGVGMSPEQAGKLFSTNQHFSEMGTSGEKGTGLGLLLCKELVALNRGKLWVDTSVGQGCNFYFTLPLYIQIPKV